MFLAHQLSNSYFTDMVNFDYSGNADYAAGKIKFHGFGHTTQITLIIFWVLAGLAIIKFYKVFPPFR